MPQLPWSDETRLRQTGVDLVAKQQIRLFGLVRGRRVTQPGEPVAVHRIVEALDARKGFPDVPLNRALADREVQFTRELPHERVDNEGIEHGTAVDKAIKQLVRNLASQATALNRSLALRLQLQRALGDVVAIHRRGDGFATRKELDRAEAGHRQHEHDHGDKDLREDPLRACAHLLQYHGLRSPPTSLTRPGSRRLSAMAF